MNPGHAAKPYPPRRHLRAVPALVLAASLLAGCATNNPQDPLEPYNRAMFTFNSKVDKAVVKPVAIRYKDVVPTPMRHGVTNFFGNLGDVWSMTNDFLQGHIVTGLNGFMRVGVNTVFGLFGVLDISTEMGLYKQPNDFGLTLARYGVPSGPFFVIPLLGPSTVRDAAGTGVDMYYAPLNYTTNETAVRNAASALHLINSRANLLTTTDLLEQISLDPYIFTRDAYLQRRRAHVKAVRSEGILSPGPVDEGGDSGGELNPDAAAPAVPAATLASSALPATPAASAAVHSTARP